MNKNNLNRIKRILSAQQGAEIPKFQGGYVIYHKSTNQPLYSKDGTSWFNDENYISPFTGSSDEFTEPELGQQGYTKNSNMVIQNTNNSLQNPHNINNFQFVDEIHKNLPIHDTFFTDSFQNPESLQLEQSIQNRIINPTSVINFKDVLNSRNKQFKPPQRDKSIVETNIKLSKEDRQLSRQLRREERQKETQEYLDNLSDKDIRNGQLFMSGMNAISDIGSVIGASQQATDSELTKNITTGYDAVANVASNFGPMGQIVGGAMKTLGALGDISQAMGGGTDQQTKLDSWMDSPLLSWNVGAINGFFGKNTDSFGVDQEALATVGSSYGGTATSINEAAESADKEYGLFSGKSRKKANDVINKAKQQQNLMKNIADQASDQRLAVQSMGEQAGLAYSMMTNGGYDQKYTYAAKQGGIINWEPKIELNWEPKIKLNQELPEFEKGGLLEKIEWIPKLQEGGKTRTLEELIEYAKKENPRFIQRLSEKPRVIKFINDEGKEVEGSHLLGYELDENGNAIVFPSIQEMENGELKLLSTWDAYNRAIENNNYLKMIPEEAKLFTESGEDENGNLFGYKTGWPLFFNNDIYDYYKDYDLSNINFIKDSQARTENNNIYYNTNEDLIHELWHYLSKNNPNKMYEDFYKDLDDDVIKNLGGDLQFVKRIDGDPGHFYHPSELEARIKAAKYITPNQKYSKEFFKNLRNDENKYGYNMRDLLHMYNDENLEKIFNLKKGGSLGNNDIPEIEETNQKNVIPEGALHKNKHHMEHAEGLTKKGIPVIDEDGEQQAEIEHSEIIFTLEVTKKLEEYYQIFYSEESTNKEKEQAALDAGKLLVYQILENTEDRTGLIESCKKGGILKKSMTNLTKEVINDTKDSSKKEQMKNIIKEIIIELLTE